ncbi:MAG: transposase [Pseudomonadota bacterium]
MNTTTIGVDLAKSVFQVSVANQAGRIVSRKRFSRAQFDRFLANHEPATLVMETCSSAHYWARKAKAYGHQPRLIHAPYVRPYVRRNKNDSADADALLRANQDTELKPVPMKCESQQALQGLHRIRSQYDKTRKQRINLVHGLLAEFGLTFRKAPSVRIVVASPFLSIERGRQGMNSEALSARAERGNHPKDDATNEQASI